MIQVTLKINHKDKRLVNVATQVRSILHQLVTARGVSKLTASAVLTAPAAAVVTMLASCQYWLHVAVSTCNCYAEKVAIARMSFERNYQYSELIAVVLLLTLTAALYALPWTKMRVAFFVLAVVAAIVAYHAYPSYAGLLSAEGERWWPFPVVSVSPAKYSEICRIYIGPLLGWRWGCTLSAFAVLCIAAEVIGAFGCIRTRLKTKARNIDMTMHSISI